MLCPLVIEDWDEAFELATARIYTAQWFYHCIKDDTISINKFGRGEVGETIVSSKGKAHVYRGDIGEDRDEWVGVYKLRDGRIALVRAWVHRGWNGEPDKKEGHCIVAHKIEDILPIAFLEKERRVLGL